MFGVHAGSIHHARTVSSGFRNKSGIVLDRSRSVCHTGGVELDKAIRTIRETSGLTQVAAARKLGISVVYLCNLEHGNKLPSLRMIDRINRTWGCRSLRARLVPG